MSGAQSYKNKMAEKVLGMAGVCQVERSSLGMYKVKVLVCRSLQVGVCVCVGGFDTVDPVTHLYFLV